MLATSEDLLAFEARIMLTPAPYVKRGAVLHRAFLSTSPPISFSLSIAQRWRGSG